MRGRVQSTCRVAVRRIEAYLLSDDNVALFETLDDLDPVGADDPDLDILAALAITIFDHHEATTFERANCLGGSQSASSLRDSVSTT